MFAFVALINSNTTFWKASFWVSKIYTYIYMQFYYTKPPVKIKKNKKLKKEKPNNYVDKIARKIFLQYFMKTAHFFFLNSIAQGYV